jgi:uncharacterized protein YkvS
MDQARHEALKGGAKFQVHKASAGNIDDFHGGLGGRVGELIKSVMVCVLYSEHFLDLEVETASFMNWHLQCLELQVLLSSSSLTE